MWLLRARAAQVGSVARQALGLSLCWHLWRIQSIQKALFKRRYSIGRLNNGRHVFL